VKTRADELGLAVAQPEGSSEIEGMLVEAGRFDVGVVVAFGMLIKPGALAQPAQGMLNVHFSLLPRWRGAAPVARALMAGDPMSGVTIIELDENLDTGPVLTAQAVDIQRDETAGELTDRLAGLGGNLVAKVLPAYLIGELGPVPQVEDGATYATKLIPDDRPIRPEMSSVEAINRIRGLSPLPGATLDLDDEPHKVLRARASEHSPEPGVYRVIGGVPVAGIADGGVELVEIQPPGGRAMSGAEWARGRRSQTGLFR
jgi:methionyl-tRNA formyltransferase